MPNGAVAGNVKNGGYCSGALSTTALDEHDIFKPLSVSEVRANAICGVSAGGFEQKTDAQVLKLHAEQSFR